MFKRSRIKIVAAIMGVLLLLFIGTLGMIYISSYIKVSGENQEMLSRYARAYWENGSPADAGGPPPDQVLDGVRKERAYRLSVFYSVLFSESGEVLSIDNDKSIGVSEEDLIDLAERLMQRKRDSGVSGSWAYLIERGQEGTLVVLMDNMILRENMATLLRYTLLFGGIAIMLLFLLSLYLARRIVRPLEESYQKQRQFISDAGHELKTPIAVVSTNAELLEREFGQSKWLDNVKFETGRMAELVRQLLDLAKTEGAEPRMTRLDFSRLVTGAFSPLRALPLRRSWGCKRRSRTRYMCRAARSSWAIWCPSWWITP